jgi:hypothetical protein
MRGIVAVATSIPAAVSYVKSRYPPPYVVLWDELHELRVPMPTGIWVLTGHFAGVPGYSTEHTAEFCIEPHSIAGGWRR